MNDKKFFLGAAAAVTIFVVSIIIYTTGSRREPMAVTSFDEREELVVVMSKDMPGLFATDEGMSGYQYDLLWAYADAAGVPLRVVTVSDDNAALKKLTSGKADIALTVSRNLPKANDGLALYSTSFAIIGRRADAISSRQERGGTLFDRLRGKKILLSQGFKSSKTYDTLLDSLKGSDIFVASSGFTRSAQDLTGSNYDYYVCEKSEAQLICSLNWNLRKVHEFEEDVKVYAVFGQHISGLDTDFAGWLADYRQTNEFTALTYQYFAKGAAERIAGRSGGIISPYDHVMREVGEREGADWRLMAAIAYSESRFKPNAVSHKGAKGLMQIMPVVARQFGVSDDDVMNPEVNLTLAVKLLNKIEASMKIPAEVAFNDRMSLVLASYNCGVGHVSDARRLAAKYGMDPNSWEDVAHFLVKKAEPEYYGDEVVRNGVFRGSSQTLAFVKSVMGRYTSYCTLAAR